MFLTLLLLLIFGLFLYHFFLWKPLDTSVLYKNHGFLLFGHRGSPLKEPENTIAAFKRAIADGCNAVELDVYRTRDGHLVITHDQTLERTTDGKGRVTDHTLAELKQLNVAANWPDRKESMATLEEVLQALPEDTVINIEIKNFSFFSEQRTELEVVRFIHKHKIRDRVIVSSFNPLNIWRVKMADSNIFTALLWHKPAWFSFRHPMGVHLTHPDIFHPYVDHVNTGVRFWSRVKKIPMHVWVVNDKERIKAFAGDPMIRGIMSDDTELLVKTVGQKEKGQWK